MRAKDAVSRMDLKTEKIPNLNTNAPAIKSLGIPGCAWRSARLVSLSVFHSCECEDWCVLEEIFTCIIRFIVDNWWEEASSGVSNGHQSTKFACESAEILVYSATLPHSLRVSHVAPVMVCSVFSLDICPFRKPTPRFMQTRSPPGAC